MHKSRILFLRFYSSPDSFLSIRLFLYKPLAPEVEIVATDLSLPMLDYARTKLATLKNVDWRQADIAALPFPDALFAAVVCQFGLMFVPDKQAAFREARRVLSKGGLFTFN